MDHLLTVRPPAHRCTKLVRQGGEHGGRETGRRTGRQEDEWIVRKAEREVYRKAADREARQVDRKTGNRQ